MTICMFVTASILSFAASTKALLYGEQLKETTISAGMIRVLYRHAMGSGNRFHAIGEHVNRYTRIQ